MSEADRDYVAQGEDRGVQYRCLKCEGRWLHERGRWVSLGEKVCGHCRTGNEDRASVLMRIYQGAEYLRDEDLPCPACGARGLHSCGGIKQAAAQCSALSARLPHDEPLQRTPSRLLVTDAAHVDDARRILGSQPPSGLVRAMAATKHDIEQDVAGAFNPAPTNDDPWAHRSARMRCRTCMWYAPKTGGAMHGTEPALGRCRRHAPTMSGYPAVTPEDWCGDHKLDERHA